VPLSCAAWDRKLRMAAAATGVTGGRKADLTSANQGGIRRAITALPVMFSTGWVAAAQARPADPAATTLPPCGVFQRCASINLSRLDGRPLDLPGSAPADGRASRANALNAASRRRGAPLTIDRRSALTPGETDQP
jgi:hypothetical protein